MNESYPAEAPKEHIWHPLDEFDERPANEKCCDGCDIDIEYEGKDYSYKCFEEEWAVELQLITTPLAALMGIDEEEISIDTLGDKDKELIGFLFFYGHGNKLVSAEIPMEMFEKARKEIKGE